MVNDQEYFVWLTTDGAAAFLGQGRPKQTRHCYTVVGKCSGEEPNGVGFWMPSHANEPRAPNANNTEHEKEHEQENGGHGC